MLTKNKEVIFPTHSETLLHTSEMQLNSTHLFSFKKGVLGTFFDALFSQNTVRVPIIATVPYHYLPSVHVTEIYSSCYRYLLSVHVTEIYGSCYRYLLSVGW